MIIVNYERLNKSLIWLRDLSFLYNIITFATAFYRNSTLTFVKTEDIDTIKVLMIEKYKVEVIPNYLCYLN